MRVVFFSWSRWCAVPASACMDRGVAAGSADTVGDRQATIHFRCTITITAITTTTSADKRPKSPVVILAHSGMIRAARRGR
ncbi:hypothetical protein GGR56DRAFT_643879 [Xylariaceae sp. FL0804]|nr:hypothetical protein GGR56DRAFT_643879 [Xylariaceae sp. FL0804]